MFGSAKKAEELVEKAKAFLDAGDVNQAFTHIHKATKKGKKNPQAWFIQGCILSEVGETEAATYSFQQSLEYAPPEMAHLPLFNLGNALQELGQNGDAIQCFDAVIQLNPEDADAYINKGRLIDDAGDHKEALKLYKKALSISPKDSIAWSNSGNSLTNLRKFDEALKCYDKALKYDPNNEAAQVARKKCLEFKEQYG